ncbi:hypothetical protein [Empedobacter tilapiae]|uniref:Uncharacterized protein n=1 Tax=Empedobacter tilapiae TaxID=2491114 RepID=A0A4Z1BEM6_9FLAO|nr:hypothetical protein [Empedobacter tilapiae]TGN23690.1 hypothetical protein E4J94_14655 [Empedobacter tilapiae]
MNQKVPIKSLLSRPRFKVFTHLSKQEFIDLIKKHLENNSHEYGGYANTEVAMIRVRKDKDKYWHPQLQIRIEEDEDHSNYLVVRGIIGPKPSIWTFFAFLYGLSGAIILTLGLYAISEYIVKGESTWVWSIPGAILLALGTYLASLYGHYLAKFQLGRLFHFVNSLLNDAEFYENNENIK